tara:strand:- start:868 stop:2664 length:1797 start_codon:yes stop_codon:yes gene_type:complete
MSEFSSAKTLRERVDLLSETMSSDVAITFLPSVDALNAERRISFNLFAAETRALTHAILAAGVQPGSTIAALLPLSDTSYQAILASMLVGTLAPMNYFLEADAFTGLIKGVRANTLLTTLSAADDPAYAAKVAAIRAAIPDLRHIVFGEGDVPEGAIRIDTNLDAATGEAWPDGLPNSPDRHLVYMLTGGTTGLPKVVPHTEKMYLSLFESGSRAQGSVRGETMLSALPLFHTSGVLNAGLIPLMAGASIVVPSAKGFRDPDLVKRYWDLVNTYGVTVGAAVPTALAAVAANMQGVSVPKMRLILTGGAPLPQTIADEVKSTLGVDIVNGWGMTETCGFSVLNPLDNPRSETVGYAIEGVEVEVRELQSDGALGGQVSSGQIGELVARGSIVIQSYLRPKPETFTEDGWLRTGDLARFDEAGALMITGRAKDLIIRGGHNIDPSIIEDAADRYPAVQLSAAVGRPDAYSGELPVLFVQLRPGEAATPQEILEFISPHIPERAAIPKAIYILDELPLSGPGKISKLSLRKRAAAQVFQKDIDTAAGPDRAAVELQDDPEFGQVASIFPKEFLSRAVRDSIDAQLAKYSIKTRWNKGPAK